MKSIKKAQKKLINAVKIIPVLSVGLKFINQNFPALKIFLKTLQTSDTAEQNNPNDLIKFKNDEDHFYRLIMRQTEKMIRSGKPQ